MMFSDMNFLFRKESKKNVPVAGHNFGLNATLR